MKRCGHEGCANMARQGGVCTRHGAIRKPFNRKGCGNRNLRRGAKVVTPSSHKGRDDGAIRGGDSRGQHSAKPHGPVRGEVDEPPRPDVEEYVATSACAIVGRDGEICIESHNQRMNQGGATTVQSPIPCQSTTELDFSNEEDEICAWIWKSSRKSRVGSRATPIV